jgi:pSer/pThr/pTyr-binding forkhead associated (FHA) protein
LHPTPFGVHIIGRARAASIVLDDPDVSRRHAELRVTSEGIWLTDRSSKNGIELAEGRRVEGQVLLGHGQQFKIGGVLLEIEHPISRVFHALEQAGEFTMTRFTATRSSDRAHRRPRARHHLLAPLAATLMFAVLSAWLW